MPRVKQIAVKSTSGKSPGALQAMMMARKQAKEQAKGGGETAGDSSLGRVVVIKGKRRFKSGTVAVREIRKYSKSTDLLFPKAPFDRLVREITAEIKSGMRYSSDGMLAMHEAAEQYVTEKFIKADLARRHAKRKTLHIEDIKFTPYMTHVASEVIGNNLVG